jgi:hypothetical protein
MQVILIIWLLVMAAVCLLFGTMHLIEEQLGKALFCYVLACAAIYSATD